MQERFETFTVLINRISRVRLLEVDPAGEATAKILE